MSGTPSSLAGKRILVTGASKGIGRATVLMLHARGANVVALSRDARDLASLADETGCDTITLDLGETDAIEPAIAAALPVDGLVNNAGIAIIEPVLEHSTKDFETLLRVNTTAPFVIARTVASDWVRRGVPGAIVNVSSIAARVGTPGHAGYCASKAGLDAVTRVLAIELGQHGIRTNSINPAITLTPMAVLAWSDPAKANRVKARMPMGRFVEPEEVASAICFLLSEESSMINGVSLDVDGGFRAG